jgi:hypothetical protein
VGAVRGLVRAKYARDVLLPGSLHFAPDGLGFFSFVWLPRQRQWAGHRVRITFAKQALGHHWRWEA